MINRRTCTSRLLAAAALPIAWGPSNANEAVVRWVVPFPAGGPLDAVARKLAEGVAPRVKQPIVVDNKAGANGSIGTAEVARAAPDGRTFALAIPDSLISVASLVKNPPYDARRDLTLITQMVASSVVLMAHAKLGASSMAEMMGKARQAKTPIGYGSWGPGTLPHLVMSAIEAQSTATFTHVPYRGAAPALQDLAGGQVQLGFGPAHVALQYQQKGLATPIAVTGQRSALLPDVPTLAEQGFKGPVEESRIWFALVAPKGLAAHEVQRWYDAIGATVRTPEFEKFLAGIGFVPFMSTPQQFAQNLAREHVVINQLIRKLGIAAS
jgi:tripartite-type tricarboxylate transporter receptor subunit TctC